MTALLDYLEVHADAQDKAASAGASAAQRAEALLRAWARRHDKFAVMAALQAEGIACAAVLNAKEVVEQHAARGAALYLQVPLPASAKTQSLLAWPFALTPKAGHPLQHPP